MVDWTDPVVRLTLSRLRDDRAVYQCRPVNDHAYNDELDDGSQTPTQSNPIKLTKTEPCLAISVVCDGIGGVTALQSALLKLWGSKHPGRIAVNVFAIMKTKHELPINTLPVENTVDKQHRLSDITNHSESYQQLSEHPYASVHEDIVSSVFEELWAETASNCPVSAWNVIRPTSARSCATRPTSAKIKMHYHIQPPSRIPSGISKALYISNWKSYLGSEMMVSDIPNIAKQTKHVLFDPAAMDFADAPRRVPSPPVIFSKTSLVSFARNRASSKYSNRGGAIDCEADF
ncbi:hypothetical protein BSLG_006012 [Batrachochytrium salamandrivorans]|nr:hypothetical protein BSLG_006012 [Batrachochytrium salamandrivorans]